MNMNVNEEIAKYLSELINNNPVKLTSLDLQSVKFLSEEIRRTLTIAIEDNCSIDDLEFSNYGDKDSPDHKFARFIEIRNGIISDLVSTSAYYIKSPEPLAKNFLDELAKPILLIDQNSLKKYIDNLPVDSEFSYQIFELIRSLGHNLFLEEAEAAFATKNPDEITKVKFEDVKREKFLRTRENIKKCLEMTFYLKKLVNPEHLFIISEKTIDEIELRFKPYHDSTKNEEPVPSTTEATQDDHDLECIGNLILDDH